MLVDDFLNGAAARLPDKIALVCAGRELSYRTLAEEASRVAAVLRECGVRRGDRVLISTENSVEAVVAIFATLRCGAVFVVINPTVKRDKLLFLLNDCRASAIVCSVRVSKQLQERAADLAHLRAMLVCDATNDGGSTVPWTVLGFDTCPGVPRDIKSPCIDVDLAALVYTSGSTGGPKGVMLTHANIVAAATSIATYLETAESDVVLSVLPLAFDYGLYQVFLAFRAGATLLLERSFAFPHAVLPLIAARSVTAFPMVPTISALLLQMDLRRYDFRTIRYITNTGANWPLQHIAGLRAAMPQARIYSMYGLSECKRVAYLPPEEIDRRPTSVGKPMPNVEVYLVDRNGHPIAAGEGELVVRGATVMKGYWERPADTERVLRPGPVPGERVLYTGDIFRIDGDGYLYFVGRRDDVIKSRGEKVSPKEIEAVIHGCVGVAEVAVFGVPDAVVGTAIKAVVTPRAGAALSPIDVRRHCANHLEDYMIPKEVEIREAMPYTATGKIDKRELKAQATV